jgi:hypothetical protein
LRDERGGGTEARAAEIVCAVKELPSPAISTILAQLVDKSMVEVLLTETPRYRLLEPIREYCLERLNADGNYEETVRRRGAWLADCGDAVHESMNSGDTDLLVASTAEFDNVRAALGRLIGLKNHDASVTAARIAGGLRFLWFLSGQYAEAQQWCDDIARHFDIDREPEVYGRVLRLKVQTARGTTEAAACEDAARFFRRISDHESLANAYAHLLFVLCRRDEIQNASIIAEARAFFAVNTALSPDLTSRFSAASGYAEALCGNFQRARADLAQASLVLSSTKSRWHRDFRWCCAEVETLAENYDEAIGLGEKALKHQSTLSEKNSTGGAFGNRYIPAPRERYRRSRAVSP